MRRKVFQKRIQCLQMRLGNYILFSKNYTGVQNCPLNTNPGDISPAVDLNRQVKAAQSDNEFLISDLTVSYLWQLFFVAFSAYSRSDVSVILHILTKQLLPTALQNRTYEGVKKRSRETEHVCLAEGLFLHCWLGINQISFTQLDFILLL